MRATQGKGFGGNIFAMSPGGAAGCHLLRVDPLGKVHYDGASDGSSGEDSESDNDGEDGGLNIGRRLSGPMSSENGDDAYDASKQALFQPATYLRPRSVPEGNKLRFSPSNLAHGVCCAFQEAQKVVVFGGNHTSETGGGMSQATQETWVYDIEGKKWECFSQIGEHEVTDTVKTLRQERGFTGDVFPASRCGHTACGVRMVKDAEPISFTTAEGQVVAPHAAAPALTKRQQQLAREKKANALSPKAAASGGTTTGKQKNHQPAMAPGFVDETDDGTGYRPTMLMFGGANLQQGTYYNDLWMFDVEALSWSLVQAGGVKPTPRWQCVSGALEQRMFIFGGEGMNFEVLNDLHLYDHKTRMWIKLRTVEPVPPPRMMHSGCTVGDKLVVVGGIGSSAKDLSDTWILEMRTLLWRRTGNSSTTAAKISPFYPVESHLPARVSQPHTVEGHVLVGFDDCVVLHGGKIGKNFNRFVWCLELATGVWSIIGEVSTQENRSSPQGRWQHCACSFREVNATHTMSLAMSVDEYKDQRIHMTEESETKALINAVSKRVARQMNFEGVLMTHGNKPVMSRTICGFIFGGSGYPRQFSDLWRLEVLDPESNQMYDLLTHGKVRHPNLQTGGVSPAPSTSMTMAGIPQAAVLADTDLLATNFFFPPDEDEEGKDGENSPGTSQGGNKSSQSLRRGKASHVGKNSNVGHGKR